MLCGQENKVPQLVLVRLIVGIPKNVRRWVKMAIVKFCSRSHNPFLTETKIQLCSLYYYKSADNDFIRDAEEGMISRTLHPPTPVVLTGDDVGRMTGLSISGTGTIRVAGRAVKTTNPIPNAYVFCTSRLDKPAPEHAASFGYDSWYVIRDANLLCEAMAQEIKRQVAPESTISRFHGKVLYLEEKEIVHLTPSDFFVSHSRIERRFYLLKRQLYAKEQEYRFVFLPVGKNGRPMQLTKERIYLESSCIRDIIAKGDA